MGRDMIVGLQHRGVLRWSVEVTFYDSKQHLGLEQPQGWSRRAVERTASMAMLLYSLVVLWFAQAGHRLYQPPLECNRPFYRHIKAHNPRPPPARFIAAMRDLHPAQGRTRPKVTTWMNIDSQSPGGRR